MPSSSSISSRHSRRPAAQRLVLFALACGALFTGIIDTLAMARELDEFVGAVIFKGDGRLETLFTAGFSFVNAPLAKIYGVAANGAFGRVALPAAQHARFLAERDFHQPLQIPLMARI